MAQIQKGTEYFDGMQVTSTNLNALVDNALLLRGSVTDQPTGSTLYTDKLALADDSALKSVTVENFLSTCAKLDGSSAMTGELILSGTTAIDDRAATPKAYVDTAVSNAITGLNSQTFVVRDGSRAMSGELTLSSSTPSAALSAASKGYVDNVASTSSALLVPTGAIMAFYRNSAPSGWLECNGQSTVGYPALQTLIGLNVPDLRGEFIRGWDHARGVDSGRALASTQAQAFESHNHTASSPAHTHSVSDPTHTHPFYGASHSHGVNDPGHSHTIYRALQWPRTGAGIVEQNQRGAEEDKSGYVGSTDGSYTGISIAAATVSGSNGGAYTGISIGSTAASVSVANSGGTETRPRNVAFMYCIKT